MNTYRDALHKMSTLIGEDAPMMVELISSYLEETPLLLDRMQTALALGDHRALGLAAHTLKSTARDFGAADLAELCQELESRSDDANAAEKINAIAEALKASHEVLVPWRNTYLANGATRGQS